MQTHPPDRPWHREIVSCQGRATPLHVLARPTLRVVPMVRWQGERTRAGFRQTRESTDPHHKLTDQGGLFGARGCPTEAVEYRRDEIQRLPSSRTTDNWRFG